MKIVPHITLFISYFFISLYVFSQAVPDDMNAARLLVETEQKNFRDFLVTSSVNPTVKSDLQKFAVNDVNSIKANLPFLVTASREKRIKGIRSLSYFMKELQQQLREKRIDELVTPAVARKYKQTLSDLLSRRKNVTIEQSFSSTNWHICQLLANAFWEFDEKKQLADISAYKRVVETPDYIFSFLERSPGFYYVDSLITFMGINYPEQLITYLQKENNGVTKSIRGQKNIYVQQLVSFSSNSLASELAPFTEQLADSVLTVDSILSNRKNVNEYFQLIVNTAMSNNQKIENGEDPVFQGALLKTLSQKALDFYVKKLNEFHSSPDAVRFQPVQNLRAQDLYYIIVNADEEMYTSTYLGLYKRLLAKFKDQSADSVLDRVNNDRFRTFMRIAATYNTLSDFLRHTTPEKSRSLIHMFISDIESNNEDEAISNASDIADAFITLSKDSVFNVYVRAELDDALKKSKEENQPRASRLYTTLLKVYEVVNGDQSDSLSANYKNLPYAGLANNGTVSELVLFYGDEDGRNSYTSFMNLFRDKTKWSVVPNESWVTISSLKGDSIKIYANLPLNDEDELDIAAQEALAGYLKSQSIAPAILIHRGHSYHLPNTLNYLNPSVKLAILGSCGGYKNMKKILEINSQVHIIASKQVGSMVVNDPLLAHLNYDLSAGSNIDWVVFWNELSVLLKKDVNASKLFEEYVPPYKNVSSYVIRLYNQEDEKAMEQ